MATINETGLKSFVTAEAFGTEYLGCRIDTSGTIALAGLGQSHDGICELPVASGGVAPVRLRNVPGTRKITVVTASGSKGAKLYAAASGKVSTTKSGRALYEALEAWSAANSIIEVMPQPVGGKDAIEGSYTAVAGDASAGYVDITHGLPATPTQILVQALSSAGVVRVLTNVVADSTKVRVTITSIAAGDVVSYAIAL